MEPNWTSSALNSSEEAGTGRGRPTGQGVGQGGKNQGGQIQPESCSSHYIKERGLCNAVGLSRGNSGRAKHIQMCRAGQQPSQALQHVFMQRKGGKTWLSDSDCRVMLNQKHERNAVVPITPTQNTNRHLTDQNRKDHVVWIKV